MFARVLVVVGVAAIGFSPAAAQQAREVPPVIDVHLHAPMRPGTIDEYRTSLEADLEDVSAFNVRHVVLTGVPNILSAWKDGIDHEVGVTPSLLFPCENGVTVMWGRSCFPGDTDWPDLKWLRGEIESGRIQALGEITTQFLGLSPSGPEFDPYFALAAEYDLPIFIHMGPGYPGGGYPGTGADLVTPNYRAALANPLLLEEALSRYPTVRVAVVHSGWPMADEMVATLYHHPQVYAEIGLLQATSLFLREEYYAFLARLVRAGYSDRILFGSMRVSRKA